MTQREIASLSLTAVADAISSRALSSREVTQACIAQAEATAGAINAVIAMDVETALDQAERADAALARGDVRGLLHGVPLAHKDMYYRNGTVSTCGSSIRRQFVPDVTATVLDRLDAAGAVTIGALNMAEFASNPTGHNEHFGHCRNPWNPDHVTGGSSSGSGAATAARVVYASLGSDTGGSIRLPAALCGVTGLKPTYGRVSRHGVMPLSNSMDHVGPLARSARDCARILSVIAGPDANDGTCSRRAGDDYEAGIEDGIEGLRIGISEGFFTTDVDPEVLAAVEEAASAFEALGATLVPVSLPDVEAIQAFGTILSRSEASAIHGKWLRERSQDYSPLVREWLEIALAVPAVRYVEALNMRAVLLAQFREQVFGKADVFLAPTVPVPAPTIAETDHLAPGHVEKNSALARFTRPFNYLGLPTLALPCGFTEAGLPLSFQLAGRPFDEKTVLRAGHAYQGATTWHEKLPGLLG